MARRTGISRKKPRSGAKKFLLAVFLLLLAAAGAAWFVFMPFGPEAETFVDLPPGSSTLQIGRNLEQAGVVRSRFAFDLLRACLRGKLKAGEYRFDHPTPAIEVYERIARGDVYTVALVVPEGANIFDIAARVQQAGLATRANFLDAAVKQAGLVADLDPQARSLEGYLFPDTYRFAPTAGAVQIVAIMVRRFRAVAAQLGIQENVHQVVTIASLVEKETAVDADRPLVASVFDNRLKKNMPLETDPSVIYGLELAGHWRGAIYQSDLTRDTAYNTYLHPGLPPGPVANPGVASLRAALHPARTDYLYFVAAGSDAQGHSLFAVTLDQHKRNVAGYRRALRKTGAP
ncbi:MAG TPA: endolytic transglycosylase MltG [Terracidiphilus sp.]|nr:endolytic transglycosylase MltG [Terracidiphilus sp.]